MLAAHACWLFMRDKDAVNRFYGPQTLDEEIAAETGGVGAPEQGGAVINAAEIFIGFSLMLALMFLGLHVATAMFVTAILGAALYLGAPAVYQFGRQLWAATEDYVLLSIPLYILLGEILVRGGATDKMYQSLADWLNPLPGGLLHTNIGASALFSAVSGSSVATAATISTIALPAFKTRKYDQRLVLGSIAAGASLGNLIPPGIAFLVYGAMTNTSAGRLYAAGVIPGAIMMLLFMATIVLIALLRPNLMGAPEPAAPMRERLGRLVHLGAPLVVFIVVMGSIYTGWATVTESAALGVMVVLPIAWLYGKLSVRMLHECFRATMRLTAMSMLILAVAFYLNFVLGLLGVTQSLAVAGAGDRRVAHAAPLGAGDLLPRARDLLRDPADAGRHGADPFPVRRRGRHRSGVLRRVHRADVRDLADQPADRHDALRDPGRARRRLDQRGLPGHPAVLPQHDRHDGDPHPLPRDRAVAAAALVRMTPPDTQGNLARITVPIPPRRSM